jgi:hypothetical protein
MDKNTITPRDEDPPARRALLGKPPLMAVLAAACLADVSGSPPPLASSSGAGGAPRRHPELERRLADPPRQGRAYRRCPVTGMNLRDEAVK